MVADRFTLFGPAHLLALGLIVLAGAGLAAAVRRRGEARLLRHLLSLWLLAQLIALTIFRLRSGDDWTQGLPLQPCDLATLAGAWALTFNSRPGFELLYFWGLVGTVPALVTPDISHPFPSTQFVAYFLLHGSVMVAWAVALFGLRLRLEHGAAWRVFVLTNLYAVAIAVFDGATGANYLYLSEKPEAFTPLDWLGPWPVYIVVTDVLVLVVFLLLELPFRRKRPTRLTA